jgi:hypothetical protein
MSAEAVTVVLHHSRAEGTAKLVLWGIANHHSDAGAWPSISTLAKYAAVSERRVQQILRELAQIGEIAIQEQGGLGQGQYKTNRYHILIKCPEDCDGTMQHRTGVKFRASGVKSGAARGEIRSPSGVKPASPEPKEEPKEEPNISPNAADAAFEDFWNTYPRKVEKLDAKKAFAKAFAQHGPVILDGVQRLAADPNLPPKQFIPYPASWLRAGGWTNEPYPERELTAEEKAEREREARERRRARELEEQRRVREERERQEREIALNPPRRCEHDRIAVVCPICARAPKKEQQ